MNEGTQSRISIYNASEMDIDWTEEEDERLRILVILKREKNWEKISNDIGRSPSQCKSRWKTYLSPSIIKITERRKWVPEEDERLTKLVRKYGTKNWRIIASHLRGRLPKQCRERWINHLDPIIVKGRLTESEWNTVLQAHEDIGNRWSEIAKLIPGRTPNQIKNHWHATLRKNSKRKCSDLFLDDDRSNDASSDSFADRDPPTTAKDFTYSLKSMSDPNLVKHHKIVQVETSNPVSVSPNTIPSSLSSCKRFCFTPDATRRKKDRNYSKLDALVQVAECMYQVEQDKTTSIDLTMTDVDNIISEGNPCLKKRDPIFRFLDDNMIQSKSMENVTVKGFELFQRNDSSNKS